jgi:hypothetical protein
VKIRTIIEILVFLAVLQTPIRSLANLSESPTTPSSSPGAGRQAFIDPPMWDLYLACQDGFSKDKKAMAEGIPAYKSFMGNCMGRKTWKTFTTAFGSDRQAREFLISQLSKRFRSLPDGSPERDKIAAKIRVLRHVEQIVSGGAHEVAQSSGALVN